LQLFVTQTVTVFKQMFQSPQQYYNRTDCRCRHTAASTAAGMRKYLLDAMLFLSSEFKRLILVLIFAGVRLSVRTKTSIISGAGT